MPVMDEPKTPNRKARRAMEAQGQMTDKRFMELADTFIDVANKHNKDVLATDLHMIFLYAAARYNAHVAKNIVDVDEHEPFVNEMLKSYQEMLRNHLADPAL
jgi:flagellin-specific chaperone FliS